MINQGIEMDLSWEILNTDDLNLNFNTNIATINNKITKLPEIRKEITEDDYRRVEGRSIYDYYMRRFAGVNPNNGNARWYKKNDKTGKDEITEDYNKSR